MNEVFTKCISRLRSPKVLIIIGLLGMALIFLSTLGGKTEEKTEKTVSVSAEDYRKALEKDIAKMVTQITGSRQVSVVITLESGIRYSYADKKEESSTDKSEKEGQSEDYTVKQDFITVKTADGGEQALLISEEMPEIRGVAIVCEGGDNELLNQKIQNTVTAALNITNKRVYICGRNH